MSEALPPADTLEVSLANDLREIAGVAAKIDEFCDARALSPQIAYAVNLSIEELLTNTIANGYDDEDPHRIEIILRREADALVVIVVDDGAPFDPAQAAAPESDDPLGTAAMDGLGILLVRQMMDDIEYRRLEGCNIVTLTKNTGEADVARPED